MKSQATPLQRHFLLIVWVLAAAAITLNSSAKENAPQAETADVGKLVKTMVLGTPSQADRTGLPARVKASKQVDLAFNVSGPLIELPFEEGQIVEKGTLLARIDPRDFENAFVLQHAVLNKIKNQYERYERLIKSRNTPISKADYDQKKSEYEVAKTELKQAKKNLNDTYLRAPFAGVVAAKYVDNFENVEAEESILRLEDISHIDIVLDVPERDVVHVECLMVANCEHDTGLVTFQSAPEKVFPATVKEYATKADPNTRTYELTLTMPRPQGINVFPGMAATVVQMRQGAEDNTTFFVPSTAVVQEDDGTFYAWVVDMDTMTVNKRGVKVGNKTEEQIQVVAGLNSGDRIVAAGSRQLKEGMKIRLWEPINLSWERERWLFATLMRID